MSENKKNLLPQLFEPLAIVALLALFLIPTLTVINLSPITKEKKQLDVLGATSSPNNIIIQSVNEENEIFSSDNLRKEIDGEWIYTTEVEPREGNKVYTKQAFRITNNSNTQQRLVVSGYTDSTSFTNFSLKIDGFWYVLRDNSKEMYEREIVLEPGVVKSVYISTYSDYNVLFKEVFTVNMMVR